MLREADRDPPYRPEIPQDDTAGEEIVNLMKVCWTEAPEARPTFADIKRSLWKINKGQ